MIYSNLKIQIFILLNNEIENVMNQVCKLHKFLKLTVNCGSPQPTFTPGLNQRS